MNYSNRIKWASAAAILVSLCWLVGDICIVGFEPDPNDYPMFSKDYADQLDPEIAIHMLAGSTKRLMFGALIGAMTAPLLLAATWLVYQFFTKKQSWYALATYYILLSGAVLSPLAHAAFFYVGEIHKVIYNTDKIAHPILVDTANSFVTMLNIAWGSVVIILLVGWVFFAICILLKKTLLPPWFAWFTPVTLSCLVLLFKSTLSAPYSGWVGGATFNIAYLLFFSLLTIGFSRKLLNKDKNALG